MRVRNDISAAMVMAIIHEMPTNTVFCIPVDPSMHQMNGTFSVPVRMDHLVTLLSKVHRSARYNVKEEDFPEGVRVTVYGSEQYVPLND